MANFDTAFKLTMDNEGGYANTPGDKGGETYRGIARNYWPKWLGWTTIDSIKHTKARNLNAVLAANVGLQRQIKAFYKTNFWDTVSLDLLHDQQLADQLFDTAVNMGIGVACKLLQKAVNQIKPDTLVIDGQVGAKTIDAANSLDARDLYHAVCQLRKAKYEAIIEANPSQAKFAEAWFSRIIPYADLV